MGIIFKILSLWLFWKIESVDVSVCACAINNILVRSTGQDIMEPLGILYNGSCIAFTGERKTIWPTAFDILMVDFHGQVRIGLYK